MVKTLLLTHCYPPVGGSFIAYRAKTIDARVLTMGRPMGFWNFIRFINDAVGSARKYNMIEAHWLYPAGIAAMIASWITGTPYRVFCHGTDVMMAERSIWWRFWARRVLNHAQEVFAVSNFLKRKITPLTNYHLRRYDGSSWYRPEVNVQPMEVDKSIFYNGHMKRGTSGLNDVVVIQKKNIGKYLAVIMQLKRIVPLAHIILMQGFTQYELAGIFNTAKVVVLASENEGYGLMLAEAAECGAKIIGVNEGGIPEVVAKYGGQLFDGTVEDLAVKIEIALKEKGEWMMDKKFSSIAEESKARHISVLRNIIRGFDGAVSAMIGGVSCPTGDIIDIPEGSLVKVFSKTLIDNIVGELKSVMELQGLLTEIAKCAAIIDEAEEDGTPELAADALHDLKELLQHPLVAALIKENG